MSDEYGSVLREEMKKSMELPAGQRRVRKLRQWWYHRREDVMEYVVVVITLILCLAVMAFFWAAFAAVESWLL